MRTARTTSDSDFAAPLAMPTTAVATPVIPEWSTPDPRSNRARDVALSTAPADGGPAIPPLVWALLAGALLGALVFLRPWQYLGRGAH